MTTQTELPRLRPYARQGKPYHDELRAILREIKWQVLADVKAIHQHGKKITVADVCRLALKYELNLKAMFDFLEDEHVLPCGTYDRVREGGIRPMTALREVWAEMQGESTTAIAEAFALAKQSKGSDE